jgi:hypothetical protein
MRRSILFVLLALVALAAWCNVPHREKQGQVEHSALNDIRIYAYRDWQSTGLRVHQGDMLVLDAEGSWLYTPDEYNGPQGHKTYRAPSFYPLPSVPGGALIGRIGEEGKPRYVGDHARWHVQSEGMLYLRIDDDILSDNKGYVTVHIKVAPAQADQQSGAHSPQERLIVVTRVSPRQD